MYVAYDHHEASYLASLCEKSYSEVSINDKSTQVYINETPERWEIAFRGTERNWGDILIDLDLFQNKKGISGGFWGAYQLVAKQVRAAVKSDPQKPIILTGHSLGAALALIAASDLQDLPILAVYTFGCPRIGTNDIDTDVRPPVYRIVNACDIVPHIPFAWWGFGHVGDYKWLSVGGSKLFRSPNLFVTYPWFLKALLFSKLQVFKDHKITEYIRKLSLIEAASNPQQLLAQPSQPVDIQSASSDTLSSRTAPTGVPPNSHLL